MMSSESEKGVERLDKILVPLLIAFWLLPISKGFNDVNKYKQVTQRQDNVHSCS